MCNKKKWTSLLICLSLLLALLPISQARAYTSTHSNTTQTAEQSRASSKKAIIVIPGVGGTILKNTNSRAPLRVSGCFSFYPSRGRPRYFLASRPSPA